MHNISKNFQRFDKLSHLLASIALQLAEAEMERIEADLRQLEELRLELAKFFCEDDATFQLDECIGVFNTFCQRFIKAIQVRISLAKTRFLIIDFAILSHFYISSTFL